MGKSPDPHLSPEELMRSLSGIRQKVTAVPAFTPPPITEVPRTFPEIIGDFVSSRPAEWWNHTAAKRDKDVSELLGWLVAAKRAEAGRP